MKPYITLTEWSKIYGDVFSFTQLGGIKTIVCSDEDSIKEVGYFSFTQLGGIKTIVLCSDEDSIKGVDNFSFTQLVEIKTITGKKYCTIFWDFSVQM